MNETKACVGLDLSLTGTGICVKRGSEIAVSTVKTTPKTSPNDLERIRYISDEVLKRIPLDTEIICVEDFFTPANKMQIGAAIKLAMLGAVVRLALYEKGLPFCLVAASQIKKFATGSGKSHKNIVVREVFKRWGIDCKDDNQADATAMAYLAEQLVDAKVSEELHQYQQDVIRKVINERPFYNFAKISGAQENS